MERNIGIVSAGTGGARMAFEMRAFAGSAQFLFIESNYVSAVDLRRNGVARSEIMLIGRETLGGHGSFNDPSKACAALTEAQTQVEEWMNDKDIIFVVATGGKGTGMGTFLPLCRWAQTLDKWVIPVFAQPCIGGEVDAATHANVLHAIEEARALNLRLVHVVNAIVFDPKRALPKEQAFRLLNESIGGSVGALAQILAEGRQIDLSDLSAMLAGPGELLIGHAEKEYDAAIPSQHRIRKAVASLVAECLDVPFLNFPGTVDQAVSSISMPETWPAWVEKEVSEVAGSALYERFGRHAPNKILPPAVFKASGQKWGITMLLCNDTGVHQPLALPPLNLDLDAIEIETSPQPRAVQPIVRPVRPVIHRQSQAAAAGVPPPAFAAPIPPVPPPPRHWQFGEFVKEVQGDKLEALRVLESGEWSSRVSVTPEEVGKYLPRPFCLQLFGGRLVGGKSVVLPDEFKELVRQKAIEVRIPDLEIDTGQRRWGLVPRRCRLGDLSAEKFLALNESQIAAGDLASYRFLRVVIQLFGPRAYEDCLRRQDWYDVREVEEAMASAVAVH